MQGEIEISLVNMGTVNRNRVIVKKDGLVVVLYFSYQTIVAVDGIVSTNDWSKTTGKLLNDLEPNKGLRVPHSEVLKAAQERLQRVLS